MSYASANRLNYSVAPEAMKCPVSLAAPSRTSQAVRTVPGYAKQQAALRPPAPTRAELSPARSEACRDAKGAVGRNEWVYEHAGLASPAGATAMGMQGGLSKAANAVCNPALPMTDDKSQKTAGQLWTAVAPGEHQYEAGAAQDRKDGDRWIHAAETTGKVADHVGEFAAGAVGTVLPGTGLALNAIRHLGKETSEEYFGSGAVTSKSLEKAMGETSNDMLKDLFMHGVAHRMSTSLATH